jgi:hypothetical protein
VEGLDLAEIAECFGGGELKPNNIEQFDAVIVLCAAKQMADALMD